MALNTQWSNVARNAMLKGGLDTQFDNGYLRIYDGSQPANAETAVGAQTLLAELRYGADAFQDPATGSMVSNAITADSSANATGTAAWFRALKSDGTTVLVDGTVGTSGANLNLNSVAIQSGAAVSVSSHTLTVPAAVSGL